MRIFVAILVFVALATGEAVKLQRCVLLVDIIVAHKLSNNLFEFRVSLEKVPSVRKTLESVGTSVKVIQKKWGALENGPTPEELKNYMDVSKCKKNSLIKNNFLFFSVRLNTMDKSPWEHHHKNSMLYLTLAQPISGFLQLIVT